MCNVHGQAHGREMKSIAETDQGESDDMMTDQLLKILARFLELEGQDDSLLGPIGRLKQIKGLERAIQGPMREIFEEGRRPKIPDGCLAHDI